MQNKKQENCHSSNTVKDVAKSLIFSPQRGFTFSFSIRLAYFWGTTLKKVFSVQFLTLFLT